MNTVYLGAMDWLKFANWVRQNMNLGVVVLQALSTLSKAKTVTEKWLIIRALADQIVPSIEEFLQVFNSNSAEAISEHPQVDAQTLCSEMKEYAQSPGFASSGHEGRLEDLLALITPENIQKIMDVVNAVIQIINMFKT